MLIELYNNTPLHRDNFIKLVEEGFYDELLFHRVINGFMIQGGDPRSKNAKSGDPLGSGGPGYQVDAEIKNFHIKGALAAARTGDNVNPKKRSSGSQFYIVQGRKQTDDSLQSIESSRGIVYPEDIKNTYIKQGGTPQLDNEYTVFGQVVKGMDVIDKIAKVKTARGDRPEENVTMTIKIIN
jgi:peptidyl-prolyl cis-trans isomerase B (cyclophilin B)